MIDKDIETCPLSDDKDSEKAISPCKNKTDIRFVTFNVCGIKNVLNYMPWCQNKTFEYMFNSLKADIICFQETKIQQQDLTEAMAIVSGFYSYFTFPSDKKGYSGVAVYVNKGIKVLKAEEGITGWMESEDYKGSCYRELDPAQSIGGYPESIDKSMGLEIDSEGRSIFLELEDNIVVICLYCPANSKEERDGYRLTFFELLDRRIRNLINDFGRQVVVMGDLNIARELIDSAEGRQQLYKEGKIIPSENGSNFIQLNSQEMEAWRHSNYYRTMLNSWLSGLGMVDHCREYYPNRLGMYTCWNVKLGARAGNFGSRIDYIISTKELSCTSSGILPTLLGSDHCPVYADFCIPLNQPYQESQSDFTSSPKLSTSHYKRFKNKRTIYNFFAAAAKGSSANDEISIEKTKEGDQEQRPHSNNHKKQLRVTKSQPKQKKLSNFWSAPQFAISPRKATNLQDSKGTDDLKAGSAVSKSGPRGVHESWKQILTPPPPPLCTMHEEPCKLMTTKKNGINRGRSFWVCPRPMGSEDKAGSTEYKCNFFKWAK